MAKTKASFCSRACQAQKQDGTHEIVCESCEKPFRAHRYQKRRFCSKSCANRARRGMKYTGNQKDNAQVRRFVALARLAGSVRCMVEGCTYNKTLDLHRLVEGQDGGSYSLDNTFMLCPNHHAEHHRGIIILRKIGPFLLRTEPTGVETQWEKYELESSFGRSSRLATALVPKTSETKVLESSTLSPSANLPLVIYDSHGSHNTQGKILG